MSDRRACIGSAGRIVYENASRKRAASVIASGGWRGDRGWRGELLPHAGDGGSISRQFSFARASPSPRATVDKAEGKPTLRPAPSCRRQRGFDRELTPGSWLAKSDPP